MTILITGASGLVDVNTVYNWQMHPQESVVNWGNLTSAENLKTIATLQSDARATFMQDNIYDNELAARLLVAQQPRTVIDTATESHGDRFIHSPVNSIQINVERTFRLFDMPPPRSAKDQAGMLLHNATVF